MQNRAFPFNRNDYEMKRAHSQASPPPHASSSSIQLPKGKKQKANLNVNSNAGTPTASSPPQFRSRSLSRERSLSVAPPNAGKGKKKETQSRAGQHIDDEEPMGAGTGGGGGGDIDNDNEEDEEVMEYSDDEFGDDQKANMAMKEDLRVLLQHFDEEQMDRYESYRRSGLAKSSVRRVSRCHFHVHSQNSVLMTFHAARQSSAVTVCLSVSSHRRTRCRQSVCRRNRRER